MTINSLGTQHNICQDGDNNSLLNRAERTAGGLAVSQLTREVGGDMGDLPPSPPNSSLVDCQTNALPIAGQAVKRFTRLVGFLKLKSLLKPIHRYFTDKAGEIEQFQIYEDKEADLVYPKVKAYHKNNPYRRYRLTHRKSSKTYKYMRAFVEKEKLDDFAVASLVLTMPKEVSEYLAGECKRGCRLAWSLFEGFWGKDIPEAIGQDIKLACHTNLHLWRTQVPTEPHFHFHSLIPNYGLVESTYKDELENIAFEFGRWEWHRQRGGRLVPFSDSQLNKLKTLWLARLQRFCKRHSLRAIEGKVDIYVDYIDAWGKLLHRFNYNGRHWSENYAQYSNEHPGCDDPPEWLEDYENRARVKGWWCNLKTIGAGKRGDKAKISPYTGEPMKYMYSVSYEGLLSYAGGDLGSVEFVKGEPIESVLSELDLEWLKGVMKRQYYELDYQDATEI